MELCKTENYNTYRYYKILRRMLRMHFCTRSPGIYAEYIAKVIKFNPNGGIIYGSSDKYLQHELEWYKSMDLNIKDHPGIEKNPIWKNCAADNGNVNSNYGWCVNSEANYNQFENAKAALLENVYSRRAIIIYTRPNIHIEQCDNEHAKQDMMCTCYTDFLIRNNKMHMTVHMRSNDVWYGLRYDLAWQMNVYSKMFSSISEKYKDLKYGNIYWMTDSLHLYDRNVDDARDFIKKIEED